ncbi:MAG TPA: GIY-YIG nuclease family protein [Candidatus Avacidaminococcus intestinavium]|uniref:GIY-YIG nuclease family protein n=1 Tax=Candidatus Avacidaminococcus intestinavium TaxID=2840684 RepID=A0A9D1MQM0_9FIRM|nr:GIY-YIG nuclease family protein [Candidatus Avacidaminococcus intestinavium]
MSDYVYILRCSDNSLYTGWTNDLQNRVKAHNSGKGAKYTKGRLPAVLVYSEQLPDKSQALKREKEIKKFKKLKKEQLILEHSNSAILPNF